MTLRPGVGSKGNELIGTGAPVGGRDDAGGQEPERLDLRLDL
jgi:hypothetical protein